MNSVSNVITSNVLAAVDAAGADASRLAEELGLSHFSEPDARVPLAVVRDLWGRVAGATRDDAFGLHAGARARRGTFGLVEYWITSSPDVREGLERFVRYYRVLSELGRLSLEIDSSGARVIERLDEPEAMRQAAEYFVSVVVTVMRRSTGVERLPVQVAFAHEAPCDADERARVLAAPVRFGAPCTEIRFDACLLDRALLSADRELARILEPLVAAAQNKLTADGAELDPVRVALAKMLRDGEPGVHALARSLKTSGRSLQRSLAAQGTTYSALVDDVRRGLSVRYLAEPRLSIAEVAFLLGFSRESAFHRAFKRWTGRTPGEYRRSWRAG